MLTLRIADLEKEIEDLKQRLPAHSVPSSMILRLEELEDELAEARQEQFAEDLSVEG